MPSNEVEARIKSSRGVVSRYRVKERASVVVAKSQKERCTTSYRYVLPEHLSAFPPNRWRCTAPRNASCAFHGLGCWVGVLAVSNVVEPPGGV